MKKAILVLSIICVLLVMIVFLNTCLFEHKIHSSRSSARNTATRVTIQEILLAVIQNYSEYHRWPVDGQYGEFSFSTVIITNSKSIFLSERMKAILEADSWGNPFSYAASQNRFTIFSSGPDEKINTSDDIKGWIDVPHENDEVLDDSSITIVGEI